MKQLAKALTRENVALEALEVAIIQLKPFYGKPNGSGAGFIKEFIDGLINRTPVEIHRVYCLDLENFRVEMAEFQNRENTEEEKASIPMLTKEDVNTKIERIDRWIKWQSLTSYYLSLKYQQILEILEEHVWQLGHDCI